MSVPSEIVEAVAKVLSTEEIVRVNKIDSRSTNTCFRVSTTENQFMLKKFADVPGLPVDRQRQYALQDFISQHELAPKPLWLSDDKGWILETWCQRLNEPTVEELAERMAQIHSFSLEEFSLNLPVLWQKYQVELPNIDINFQLLADQWKAFQESHSFDYVLCHNDLHMVHLAQETPLCFDWEYSGHHCRFFDLACCIKINQLDSASSRQFLTTYAVLTNNDNQQVSRLVQGAMYFADVTFTLWEALVAKQRR